MNGADLRAARKARGLSTQTVARHLGVHRNTVIRWEAGAVIPGPAQFSLGVIFANPALMPSPRISSSLKVEKVEQTA